jgi:hypothetical protein
VTIPWPRGGSPTQVGQRGVARTALVALWERLRHSAEPTTARAAWPVPRDSHLAFCSLPLGCFVRYSPSPPIPRRPPVTRPGEQGPTNANFLFHVFTHHSKNQEPDRTRYCGSKARLASGMMRGNEGHPEKETRRPQHHQKSKHGQLWLKRVVAR